MLAVKNVNLYILACVMIVCNADVTDPQYEGADVELSNRQIGCEQQLSTSNIRNFINENKDVDFDIEIDARCSGSDQSRIFKFIVLVLKFIFTVAVEEGMSRLFDLIVNSANSGELQLIAGGDKYSANVHVGPIYAICADGQKPEGKKCVDCPTGSYQRDTKCVLCEKGKYQDEEGASRCKNCPWGTTTLNLGSSNLNQCIERVDCPMGSYPKNYQCVLCDFGTYLDVIGQTECKDCPRGYTTQKTGATGRDDCIRIAKSERNKASIVMICIVGIVSFAIFHI